MPTFAIHNEGGVITMFRETPDYVPATPEGFTATEVTGAAKELARQQLWMSPTGLEPSERVVFYYDTPIAECDGVDQINIAGLPEGCWLNINGQLSFSPGSVYTISRYEPGQAIVKVVGQYYSNEAILTFATLEDIKALKRTEINTYRDQAMASGCTVEGVGRFDTDPTSIVKINGAVTGAIVAQSLNAPFSITWTLADDTSVDLDAPAMIGVGLAVMQRTDACHGYGRTLKGLVDAATNREAVEVINAGEGWPP